MSDIDEINKAMTSEFSGLKINPNTNNEKLVKIVYGDDKHLAKFIKRLGNDQTLTKSLQLPAAGVHLKNINTTRLSESLHLTYHLVVVTETEEAANQVTEQIFSLLSPPLALSQRGGGRFALKSKYAKVELYDNALYEDSVLELLGFATVETHTRRYVLGVTTNYGEVPEKEQKSEEDEPCVSNSEN